MSGPIKEDFSLFLKNNAFWIALSIVIIILLVVIFYMCFSFKKKKESFVLDSNELISALGGKENIIECSASGSRVTIKLNDKEKINREIIKKQGVKNIVEMQNKIILVGDNSEMIFNAIK